MTLEHNGVLPTVLFIFYFRGIASLTSHFTTTFNIPGLVLVFSAILVVNTNCTDCKVLGMQCFFLSNTLLCMPSVYLSNDITLQ